MGAKVSCLRYTLDELDYKIPQMALKNDRVIYAGPGVLIIKGISSIFNPLPPLNTEWLNGYLTADQFQNAIETVNNHVKQALVGHVRMEWYDICKIDVDRRNYSVMNGAKKGIEELNRRFRDRNIRFVLDINNNNNKQNKQDTTLSIVIPTTPPPSVLPPLYTISPPSYNQSVTVDPSAPPAVDK